MAPKVFASYSHDSDERKEWVHKLCTKLREDGADVILDQWDIRLGTDQALFMEKLSTADRVLVICTNNYVKKADNREGGVGYEGFIITAQIAENLKTAKFIPIIRQSSNQRKMPIFLGKKQYTDFTDDDKFDEKFNELLHDIHDVPITPKPPLGENPLLEQSSESEVLRTNLPNIPAKVESVSDAYDIAFELAKAGRISDWSRFVEEIRSNVFKSLVQWRKEVLDKQQAENIEQRYQIMDKAVDIVSPLISVALVGVEWGDEHLNNQGSLLDDLLNIQSMEGWNRIGYMPWIEISYALGYVYHNLHGGLCLHINRLDLAFSLAQSEFPFATDLPFTQSVWENYNLMGSCESLGNNRVENWKYLANAFKRWEWLSLIFKDDREYRISLAAYHMALGIHELAAAIASGKEKELKEYHVRVKFYFLTEEYEIIQRAPSLLVHHSELSELWTCLDVTRTQMKSLWEAWIKLHKSQYWYSDSTEDPPEFLNFF